MSTLPGLRPLAALLLGAVASTAFAPLGWWPMWPLTLAASLRLIRNASVRSAAWIGFCFGLGQYLSGLYWTVISTHVYGGAPAWLGVGLCLTLSAYLSLYAAATFALYRRFQQQNSGALCVAFFVAAWVLGELVRGWFFSGFPWLSAGYSLGDTGFGVLAPLTGVFGLSALACFWAVLLSRWGANPLRQVLLPILATGLLLLLPKPQTWTQASGPAIAVAMVQGNFSQDLKWQRGMQQATLDRYSELTLASLPADLVVWPEVAVTVPLEAVRDGWLRALGGQLRDAGATALVGITRFEDGVPFNSVVGAGLGQGMYDKRHLVPFGEYFPVPDWVRPIMEAVGTPYGDVGFGAPMQARLSVAGVPLALSICFEDVFGDEVAQDAREASLLVNVTNDAWFADSVAPHQHFQIARMRARETGRPMVRVANTGITAHIDANGDVPVRTAQFQTEVLKARIQGRSGLTPYMHWRDLPLWLGSLGLLALLSFGPLIRRRWRP